MLIKTEHVAIVEVSWRACRRRVHIGSVHDARRGKRTNFFFLHLISSLTILFTIQRSSMVGNIHEWRTSVAREIWNSSGIREKKITEFRIVYTGQRENCSSLRFRLCVAIILNRLLSHRGLDFDKFSKDPPSHFFFFPNSVYTRIIHREFN